MARKVRGATTKPPIDAKGRITIRFQGIDAPELHYRPAPPGKSATPAQRSSLKPFNKEYRQRLGESATVALAKLFRRQATWWAYKKAGVTTANFKGYLQAKRDELMLTGDFLAHGVHSAATRFLDEFLETDGTFTLRPKDMVFKEKSSTLVDASGKKITAL